jgi:hypothetical protein
MALDYFVLVFIASTGVYQITAIHAKLDGLCFFKNRIIQYIFGILAVVGAFVWFFLSKERNVHSGVEGSQQLGLFLASILASYFVTAILASIIQAKVRTRITAPSGRQHDLGIETLKTNTLLGSILSRLRKESRDKV